MSETKVIVHRDGFIVIGEEPPTYLRNIIRIFLVESIDSYELIGKKYCHDYKYADVSHYFINMIYKKLSIANPPNYDEFTYRLMMKNEKLRKLIEIVTEKISNEKIEGVISMRINKNTIYENIQSKQDDCKYQDFVVNLDHNDIFLAEDDPLVIETREEVKQERLKRGRIEELKSKIKKLTDNAESVKHDLELIEDMIRMGREELERLEK